MFLTHTSLAQALCNNLSIYHQGSPWVFFVGSQGPQGPFFFPIVLPCKDWRAVKSKDPLNGIAVHVQKTAHNINWQEAGILARENNWRRRRVLEALEIQQRRAKMNLDASLRLDRLWTPFVRPRSGSRETVSVLAGSPNPI